MDSEAAMSSGVIASTGSATPLTVRQASANLWTAKEPELHHALRDLHKALLRDSVRSYSDDMANVFLAIQGAALRMRIPILNNNHQWHTSVPVVEDILVQQWSVLEESLWALAGLVQVCVGPAWWIQAQRRRRFRDHTSNSNRHHNHHQQQQSHTATSTSTSTTSSAHNNVQRTVYSQSRQRETTPTTLPDDGSFSRIEGASSSSAQSSSSEPYSTHSMHASVTTSHHQQRHLHGQLRNNIHLFPSMAAGGITVDEILPASILRFASKASHIITASMDNDNNSSSKTATSRSRNASRSSIISLEQRMSLVEAQIIIVQHLCCAHHSIHHVGNSNSSARYQQPQWNIPGAHETVGIILSQSLKLVCTGRSSLSFHDNRDLLSFVVVHVGEEDIDDTNEEKIGATGGDSDNVQGEKKKRSKTTTILPSASKDQWKHILLVTRATTDLLSSGWRPLPQGKEGADAVLALLVIASRGTKLNDLNATYSAQDTATSTMESCEERVLASSCATEAMAALLSISQRGLIPLKYQSTLVRTVCRLKTILRDTMETGGHHLLLCPPFVITTSFDGVPSSSMSIEEKEELEHQVEFFASQRELCLADASTLLWTMLSHEAHVESSVEVLFSILQTATDALGGAQDNFNSLNNKLKWNDQTEDYVLADCATVVGVLSTTLWGAPDLNGISMLRIFWHSAIEIFCGIISTSSFKFAMTEGDAGRFSLIRTNYFIKRVSALVVVAIEALEKAVGVGIGNRGGSGVLSTLEWEAIVEGIEKGVLPWLDFSRQMSKYGKYTSALVDQIQTEAMELLLHVAEVLDYYVKTDGFPAMEYNCLKRLVIYLLKGSALFDADERSEQMEVTTMYAWSRFGLFPYRLIEWKETAAEILREAFLLKDDGTHFYSPPVRLAALESLTFEKTEKHTDTNNTGALSSQSLLTTTQNMGDIHSAILKECLLPTLRLILVTTHLNQMPATNTTGLELYAVNLAGRIFLSTSADLATRSELVNMLKCISTSLSDVAVRTGSSWQLYLCLRGVFCDLPTAYKSIPIIVDAVCEIFQSTVNTLFETSDELYEENGIACFGVLRTLGCLRLRSRDRLAFHNDTALIHSINNMIASQRRDTANDGPFGATMAVFIRVDDGNTGKATISSEYTRFSFQTVIEQLVFAIRKIDQAEEPKKPNGQSLFASLRRSCLEILCTLLIEGVSLNIPREDLTVIFRRFDAGEKPVVVNTLVMATQSLVESHQEFSAVLDLLAEYASSASSPTDVAAICRGIFPFLTSAADKSFDINKISKILLDRLEREENQFTAVDGSNRVVVSLLCVLTAIARTRALAFPESEETRRTFASCSSIVFKTYLEPKSILLHTALQGALRILASFTQEEAQHARQTFLVAFKDHKKCAEEERGRDYTETTFAPLLLKNVLDQQSQIKRPSLWEKENEAHMSKSLLQLSDHQRFTVLSEQQDRFAVETARSGGWQTCAAWLCCHDSVVFTCRVGSASSRYRGHVEVCLRSPTFHARQLIMIPGKIALEDPEFPLPLWSARSPDPVSSQEDGFPSGYEAYEMKESSTDVLDHAQSLIDRFDSMFAKTEGTTDAEERPGNDSCNSEITKYHGDLSAVLDRDSGLTDTTGALSFSSLLDPSHEMRSIASSNRDDTTIASSQASAVRTREHCIFDWFVGTFGWNEEEFDLQERMNECLLPRGLRLSREGSSVFHNYEFQEDKQLAYDEKLERAITILDRTATCDTYKFGLLYFKERSLPANEPNSAETQLLSMPHCSPAFHEFASRLGTMTPTRDLKYFSAGLDVSEYESDGRYTIAWMAPDETSSVVFHVVNLMPDNFNGRKRHIGNDNVLIIFVEETSAVDQLIPTQKGATGTNVVSGQFVHATIFVMPLSFKRRFFKVTCRIRADLPTEIKQVLSDFAGEDLVHEKHVASFARSLAMRIDLTCRTVIEGLPPPTNCLERCRKISELKRYAM